MGLIKLVIRILAVVGKEITEVRRRPGAIVSLILGPFLILAVFGIGYQGIKRDLNAIVVVGPNSKLPTDVATYQGLDIRGIKVIDVTTDAASAEDRLRADQTDVVIVVPPDPLATLESGKQAELRVIADVSDPVLANYTSFMAETLSAAVNREIYRIAAEQGQKYIVSIGGRDLSKVPPEVIASPTTPVLQNLAPVQPTIVGFYSTAALALVLQHLAVTLIALSIVRERASGALDRFRASPMRATELVVGKVLAFGLLGAAPSTAESGRGDNGDPPMWHSRALWRSRFWRSVLCPTHPGARVQLPTTVGRLRKALLEEPLGTVAPNGTVAPRGTVVPRSCFQKRITGPR